MSIYRKKLSYTKVTKVTIQDWPRQFQATFAHLAHPHAYLSGIEAKNPISSIHGVANSTARKCTFYEPDVFPDGTLGRGSMLLIEKKAELGNIIL